MSRPPFAIDTDALHAFADGQLSAEQRGAVDQYLALHPDAAALVAQWQRQNDAIATLFSAPASEPVPRRLAPQALKDIDAWIEPFRAQWQARMDNLDAHLATMKQQET